MSHFAHVKDGKVDKVIVAEQDFINSGLVGDPSEWIQTSYNTQFNNHPEGRPLRGNFAGVGYSYDKTLDVFIPPKPPYKSWTLSNTYEWVPPIPYPLDGKIYLWDDNTDSWIEAT
jgi:hypothetical protein